MKQYLTCTVLLFALGLTAIGSAQDGSPRYAQVDYMKVPKDKVGDYLEVEKIWKKIHQKRMEKGLITAWFLYQVDNAPADKRDYQFVTVNLVDSFAKLENPFPDEVFAAAYSEEELQQYMTKTSKSRDLIRSEVWHVESLVSMKPGEEPEQPPYITVDYIQPVAGNEDDYAQMEQEVFQKLHQERVNRQLMQAWIFHSRRFPGGSDVPHSYVTVNIFPSAEKANAWPADLVKAVFPNEDLSKHGSPEAYRKVVKQDVWKPIDHVMKVSQPGISEAAPAKVSIPGKLAQDLIGTWVHTGRPGRVSAAPKVGGRLKLRTGTHWAVVQTDPTSGVVIEHFGGTYTVNGDMYVETQHFADNTWQHDNGKSFEFTVTVEGDLMTQIGVGNPYTEVWQRVR